MNRSNKFSIGGLLIFTIINAFTITICHADDFHPILIWTSNNFNSCNILERKENKKKETVYSQRVINFNNESRKQFKQDIAENFDCIKPIVPGSDVWNDNRLCYEKNKGVDIKWFHDKVDPISEWWDCVELKEPSDHSFGKNFLCISPTSPITFSWLSHKKHRCEPVKTIAGISWANELEMWEHQGSNGWADNRLCIQPRYGTAKHEKWLSENILSIKLDYVILKGLYAQILKAINKNPSGEKAKQTHNELKDQIIQLKKEIAELEKKFNASQLKAQK